MPKCRENRKRKVRATKKLRKWRRAQVLNKLAEVGAAFIKDKLLQPSFISMIFKVTESEEEDGQYIIPEAVGMKAMKEYMGGVAGEVKHTDKDWGPLGAKKEGP